MSKPEELIKHSHFLQWKKLEWLTHESHQLWQHLSGVASLDDMKQQALQYCSRGVSYPANTSTDLEISNTRHKYIDLTVYLGARQWYHDTGIYNFD